MLFSHCFALAALGGYVAAHNPVQEGEQGKKPCTRSSNTLPEQSVAQELQRAAPSSSISEDVVSTVFATRTNVRTVTTRRSTVSKEANRGNALAKTITENVLGAAASTSRNSNPTAISLPSSGGGSSFASTITVSVAAGQQGLQAAVSTITSSVLAVNGSAPSVVTINLAGAAASSIITSVNSGAAASSPTVTPGLLKANNPAATPQPTITINFGGSNNTGNQDVASDDSAATSNPGSAATTTPSGDSFALTTMSTATSAAGSNATTTRPLMVTTNTGAKETALVAWQVLGLTALAVFALL